MRTIVTPLKNTDFKALSMQTQDARLKLRLLALDHFKDGCSRHQIAKYLKVSRTSVNKWVRQYLEFGVEGITSRPNPGRPARLTEQQLQQVYDFVHKNSLSNTGGRIIARDLQAYIQSEFGIHYHCSAMYKIMHKLGFSWITSRSKHPKQSPEVQADFKKN
jgi:transposase